MKVLLGTCVWKGALEMIRAASHDANWVGDWNKVPGDEAILRQANSESRIFVTIGKDFGELAVLRGLPHHGILRIFSARQHGDICLAALAAHGEVLLSGAIITAEPGRMRIRLPETSE